ncbi:putative RNA polymerase II subunit B1 CTD phosphatase RPAP2 [Pectinophora gossypiella]|uniref:putative RNA polymerase II subunit B1 CTD phosphatase RPAP2 n=1 Tax=Pectinophora gossypiella TaxID=13191 RepID=UPI00214EBF14|nr:putative RNA polymerase II subunit B1 CTD phosphatase RPAP2 [Pectinophora gossypiella]
MESLDKKPKKKPTKIEEMTKEQIRAAILKKRECNAKAQSIVESLLETGITDTYFLQCLPDINQSHFDDIVEERCILRLCGYPVCSKTLLDKDIPKQKYRISLKTNKVYDITARKSFCSNGCYKSAMHVKKQMLTSPLWFREYEEIPKFHLTPIDTVGSLGQEIDVSLIEKIKIRTTKTTFTSINDFASASLNDMTDSDQKEIENIITENATTQQIEDNKTTINNEISEGTKTPEIALTETPVTLLQTKENISNENIEAQQHTSKAEDIKEIVKSECSKEGLKEINKTPIKKPHSNPMNIVGDIVERPERIIDPILLSTPEAQVNENVGVTARAIVLSAKKIAKKKPPAVTILTIEVEKCLAEWFSLDTLLFLFGDAKVKEMVTDKGECIKEYLNNYARSISYNANTYDQYQQLCRKLNMLELEDRRYDSQTLNRETKPLPDYSMIKEESKRMQLKVKAFLAGATDVPEIVTTEQNVPQDDAAVTQLPLVDKNAQNALRRRIVCEHLNKVLPDLLRSLGLLTLSISSDVRLMVNTFKLKANNIMFKPIQWTLIAIIIIKLLSLRDKRLEYLLGQQTAYQHMQLLLLSYKQDGGYLDRLISWLTDVDRLLDTNDTQLTIE